MNMPHVPKSRSFDQNGVLALPDILAQSWTKDDIRHRLTEAADTIRRLLIPKFGIPAGVRAGWPDVVYEWTAYGYSPTQLRKTPPSSEAIDRLDQTLPWLYLLTNDQRKIVWARADGLTWRTIEALDDDDRKGRGRQERQLRNIYDDAEARILAHLNGTRKRAVIG